MYELHKISQTKSQCGDSRSSGGGSGDSGGKAVSPLAEELLAW